MIETSLQKYANNIDTGGALLPAECDGSPLVHSKNRRAKIFGLRFMSNFEIIGLFKDYRVFHIIVNYIFQAFIP